VSFTARRRPIEEPVDLSGGPLAPATEGRRVNRRGIRRAVLGALVFVGVLAAAYLVPLPSVERVREWSDGLGPWFVVVFFFAYAVITIGPIPRSPFTVMSGVLFGPATGFAGSMLASTAAALAAFVLVRRFGRERVQPYLQHRWLRAAELRLERRGWLAVGSLRMIAACPFSVCNYASALSSVRPAPYLLATVIGMAPGTAAVVFLGDALAGQADPAMIVASAGLFLAGVAGLVLDARMPVTGGRDGAPPAVGADSPAAIK